MSCPHKHIAKWHIFQTNRELFKTQASPLADTADFSQLQNTAGYPPTNDLKRMAKYIYDKKKIPVDLSDVTKFKAISEYPSHLSPSESTCTHCLKSPTLDHPVNITEKAKIITTLGVIEDISTYYRRCPECQMTYRYQEWQDGLHNFDDHVVLSLELCLFLRHSLQNHTSISRAINSLEGLRKVQYPARDTILHAYCHFEALMSTDYTYSCVACGYYPSVVVMNLHKKSPFNLGLSEFKEPPINYNGEQNIVEFWDSINLEMICRGFVHSSSQNPCVVQPRYEHWAPWIGTVTRKCDTVLNTEHEKVSCPQSSSEAVHTAASEDHLFDKLMKQKMSSIRQLCKACNTDTKGSRVELILRLREEVKDRQTYNKVFQKIWGTWGGWSVISCPHGVVYSFKFNLWRESPRDFADLLLSWKHLPNVCVYDFASELATHTNLRVPSPIPFWPFEGRLAESTPESLRSAQLKKLQISLPWLSEKCENPEPNGHPLTGSSQHFLLCDTLRETNTKHPQDVLKRTELVPELRWMLNSKIVSKLFSAMQKNDYFLKNMAASTQMFAMRSIIHHRNTATNTRLLELQPLGESPLDVGHITLSALGQQ
ncbi:HMG domain-containing protein 3-like [Hoplias malabaricus]|uniref:HMG domain-containing protein 3-like n=1 Tax=Hoplias malabaricus TaxID=27720 RepID=UPI003461BF65